MALEPVSVAAPGDHEEENPELRDMSRRFWFSVVVTVPVVILAMAHLFPHAAISQLFSMRTRVLIELALATPVCVWAAWPFHVRAVQSVRNRSLNEPPIIEGPKSAYCGVSNPNYHRKRARDSKYGNPAMEFLYCYVGSDPVPFRA